MKDQATARSGADHEPDRDAGNCDAGASERQAVVRPAGDAGDDSADAALDRLRVAAIASEASETRQRNG